jgi:hypothetical protein
VEAGVAVLRESLRWSWRAPDGWARLDVAQAAR